MNFYWVGFIFSTLIVSALLLSIYGLWKKSWQSLIMSGIAFLLPMLYFAGAENWFKLLILVPLVPFVLAYYVKKKFQNA